jgi:hypothetical protein
MDYRAAIRDGTFLAEFMDYMDAQETASAYDFWTGMWLLGNACGRSAYVDRPRAPVFLNWYVILVAESGITRKSTAVRIATDVLRETNDQLEQPAHIIQSKITPEMLEWRLHELSKDYGYAHVAISISELVTLLGKEHYSKPMPGLLTDLYDADKHRAGGGTVGKGTRDAHNVYVSVLSASTPTWLQRAINPDVVEGGFTSRTLFVVSDQPKRRIAWPTEVRDEPQLRESIVSHLQQVRDDAVRFGRITLSDGGMRQFSNWYQRRKLSRDSFRGSFESREDAHVLRASACLAANDRRWLIEANDVKTAIRLIGEVKEWGSDLFEGSITHSKYIAGIDRMRTLLISAGMSGIAQQRLSTACQHYLKAPDVQTVLEIMHELGLVQRFEIKTGQRGRPKTIWRATASISVDGAMERVLQEVEPT